MVGRWPRPQTDARFFLLVVGAAAGPLGALGVVGGASDALAWLWVVFLCLFAVSHASAVQVVSPRLATWGALAMIAGAAGLGLAQAQASVAWHAASAAMAWLGMGTLAAALWFDHRRTFGMAGLGVGASFVGLLALGVDALFGVDDVLVSSAAAWPGGATLWQWALRPSYVAFLASVVWFVVTGLWLLGVHSKEHHAFTRAQPGSGQP